jgi:hypothetical protein
LQAQLHKSRIEGERAIPYRHVAYRWDQTTRGRRIVINGEIRCTTISRVAFWIEFLRRLADDTERLLDLEDGVTSTFNAKLVDPSYIVGAEDWIANDYRVPYSATLLEVA